MKKKGLLFRVAEGWLRVENLLFTFWAMFWVLNGLDKFFNGKAVKDETWGSYHKGWFGVNRDEKFIHYFDRLSLPEELALGSLYTFAVLEVLLGMAFLSLLFQGTPKVIHRTCFKSSLILFTCFMTGDILFGDRTELWEHGTFMILVIITFQLYLDRALIRKEVLRELGVEVKGPVSGPLMGLGGSLPPVARQASVTREFNLALDAATSKSSPEEEPTQGMAPVVEHRSQPQPPESESRSENAKTLLFDHNSSDADRED
jgi:hypothetical protein